MRDKTIVFVTTCHNLRGADFSMHAVINKLKQNGFKCLIVMTQEGRSSNYWKKNNVDYVVVPFKNWVTKNNNLIWRFFVKVYKKILNKYLLIKNLKKIKQKTSGDIVLIYANGFTNDFAVSLSKKLKKPCVYHIREFGDLDFKWKFINGKAKQYEIIEPNVSLFIAISNAVKQSFSCAKNYEKIEVIYNGIPVNDFKKNRKKDNFFKIIISGRVSREKGHFLLLDALKIMVEKNITNFKLDIVGEGPATEEIKKLILKNNLQDYVELKGFVSKINYCDYDIGIMASDSEAFGRVTVEYMMNGLATIASKSGANAELIEEYYDGLFYEKDNSNDLSNKITEVIQNKELFEKITTNAVNTAKNKFSEEKYVENVYESLVRHKLI